MGLLGDLERRGVMRGYEQHILRLEPVLLDVSRRGVPVDAHGRIAYQEELQKRRDEIAQEMQQLVPLELLNCQPKQGYKKVPVEVEHALQIWQQASEMARGEDSTQGIYSTEGGGASGSIRASHGGSQTRSGGSSASADGGIRCPPPELRPIPQLPLESVGLRARDQQVHGGIDDELPRQGETATQYVMRRTGMMLREFKHVIVVGLFTEGAVESSIPRRWCKLIAFKPSSDQLIRYMKFRGHKVPRNFKTGKETSEAKQLERLAKQTGDPLYKKVIEHRNHTTMLQNFLENWEPGNDGRVHSTFFYAPGTGQLSSRRPNVQNASKPDGSGSPKDRLAVKFREMIRAPEGCKIVECVAPHTRILMRNLTWRRAEDIREGDELWGFDEEPTSGPRTRPYRAVRASTVLSTRKLSKPCVTVVTDQATVLCSLDHFWARRTAGRAKWVCAQYLKPGHRLCHFVSPWEVDDTRDGGWLAGILDGEGWGGNRGQRCLTFGQNPGAVADTALRLFAERNLHFDVSNSRHRCLHFALRDGKAFGWLRAIGMLRPVRLIQKAMQDVEGMAYWGKNSSPATVLSCISAGEREVVAIETTTHTFCAEGLVSHNCDYKSFHALTTGFESKDADYMRLARLDIHAYVAAHLKKLSAAGTCLSWPDDQLREFLAEVKQQFRFIRDKKAKPAILGYGFGLRERHFYEMNQESFESLKEARYVLHLLDDLFPRCAKWRKDVTVQAHRQTYLQSRHGYLRYFFDVYHWDSRRQMMIAGDDHEAAIAFLPANDAHGHLKDAILEIRARGWDELYGLSNTIHDSLIFLPEDAKVSQCIADVKPLMEQPSKILVDKDVAPEGLVCRVSASVGENWASMSEAD